MIELRLDLKKKIVDYTYMHNLNLKKNELNNF